MASFSLKDYSTVSSYPRALSSIIISVGLLAVFITFASWILLSHPIGSVVRGYFYEGDPTSGLASPVDWNNGRGSEVHGSDQLNLVNTQLPKVEGAGEVGQIQNSGDRHKSEVSVSSGYDKVVQEQENENPLTTNNTESFGKSGIVGSEAHDNDNSDVVGTQLPNTEGVGSLGQIRNTGDSQESDFSVSPGNGTMVHAQDNENPVLPKIKESAENGSTGVVSQKPEEPVLSGNGTVSREQDKENLLRSQNEESADIGSNDASTAGLSEAEDSHSTMDSKGSVESECDLFHGEWFYDSAGPAYTNNTCPVITQMQNCQGNGRPDNEYESWRWKPYQCELPRFNATKFLELMSGKTLAFVGDSVARNQMESLLCLLWQVEVPKNRGNRHMQRWYFRSKSVMIIRIWSSWLVHQTSAPFKNLPEGVAKLHLDVPDETFMQYIPNFDVVVLSSGHWFAKQSIYLLNYDIVGTQLWSPPNHQPLKVNNVEAFGISVETSIAAMATHPNYTGLTILRSYSPDHYEGGAWNTGGSCTGKVKPVLPGKLVENGFTNTMHEKQVTGFHRGIKKQTNRSKLKLMDITDVFSYRHDGHPGPYRSPDPNKITKRGPDGKPPPQDCLHWCMPGPVDTWNELVLEIIRREFEGVQNPAS